MVCPQSHQSFNGVCMTPNEFAAVQIERASFSYPGGKAGIRDIDLNIAEGELVVCIGPSGCGKTTLLKLIAGFLPCSQGRVCLAGEDVTALSVRDRQCGIVFQSYALFPHMRVWENVAYPLRVRGIALDQRRREADAMLELVGLQNLGERLPAALSGGQQQRVALARALIFKPRVLLLDEPLSALDAATRVSMRDEIRRIQKQQKIATLLITHDQDEALSLADRIVLLRDGQLVQTATPQAMYDTPANAFAAGFIGRANFLDGRVTGPEHVETSLGKLHTHLHLRPEGAPVQLLIRPERIQPANDAETVTDNIFAARVLHDRFHGARREVGLSVGTTLLWVDTPLRTPFTQIHVPRDAVQFLPTP